LVQRGLRIGVPTALLQIESGSGVNAEVASAFPSITTLEFPSGDTEACWRVMGKLRALLGKPRLSEEDRIRVESVRGAASSKFEAAGGQIDDFLAHSEAVIHMDMWRPATHEPGNW
jgi:hypothetical protein